MQLFARGRCFPSSACSGSLDHAQQRADWKLAAERVELIPCPPLGPRVERGRIPFLPRVLSGRTSRFWPAVVRRVLGRPLLAVLLSAGVLLALAYPSLSLRLSNPSDLALTAQSPPALKALAAVRRAVPRAGAPAYVVTRFSAPRCRGRGCPTWQTRGSACSPRSG